MRGQGVGLRKGEDGSKTSFEGKDGGTKREFKEGRKERVYRLKYDKEERRRFEEWGRSTEVL